MQILKRIKHTFFTYGLLVGAKKISLYLGKFLYCNIYRLSPFTFCISLYGVYIKKGFSGSNATTFKYCLIGQYGKYFSNFLKNQKEASIFLDVGANLGIYSLVALKNPFVTKIFSFEPQRIPFDDLTENIQRNSGNNKCTPIKYGISHKSKKSFLKLDDSDSGKAKLKVTKDGETTPKSMFSPSSKWEDIELIGNEELSRLLDLDLSKKIGVKIDTEGHEFFVLQGLMNTNFWQNISWIFMEFSRKVDHQRCLDIMDNEGFNIVGKVGGGAHYDLLFKKVLS